MLSLASVDCYKRFWNAFSFYINDQNNNMETPVVLLDH